MDAQQIITHILRTTTIKHISISTIGTILNGLLGAIFFIVMGRVLGPAQFGILMVAITTLTLLADIADLGVNTGLINFLGRYRHSDPTKVRQFLKLGLEIKLLTWAVIGPLLYLTAQSISVGLFNKPELTTPLHIVSLGMGGLLLFSYLTNAFQALEKYVVWSAVNIFSNSLRLILFLGLLALGIANLTNSLWIYCAVLFIATVSGWFFLPKKIWSAQSERSLLPEFTSYTNKVALFIVLAAIAARLDTFLTAHFLPQVELGIYSAASQLTAAAPQLVFAIAAAIAPKLANFQSDRDAKRYLVKLQWLVTGLALIILVGLPLSFWVLPLLYGIAYQASIWPFIILMIGQLIFLLSIPTHQAVFYYFQRPGLFVGVSFVKLIVMMVVGWWLIPNYGAIGAAWTVVLGSVSDAVIPAVWVVRRFQK